MIFFYQYYLVILVYLDFHFDLDFLCLKKFDDHLFDSGFLVEHFEDLTINDNIVYYRLPSNKNYVYPDIFNEDNIETLCKLFIVNHKKYKEIHIQQIK